MRRWFVTAISVVQTGIMVNACLERSERTTSLQNENDLPVPGGHAGGLARRVSSGPDCPPEPEGEGPFSEAVKEMLKEFVKCEAEDGVG